MRSLHLINGLGTGGAERSLAELLPRLPAFGIQPTVVCLHRRDEGVERAVVATGVDVRFVEAESLPLRVSAVRRLVRELRTDLVHTTIFEADQVGRLASIGLAPVLTSLVNTTYDSARLSDPNVSRRRLRAVQLVDASTAPLTRHFHAITDAVKQATVRDLRVSGDRITVVPRGRDAQRLGTASVERRRTTRSGLDIDDDAPVVLHVGRQEHQKGHVHLLDAAAQLRASRPNLVWLLAGREGNASDAIRRRHAELGLEGTVRFLGHRDDVPDLLGAADVFVFPSLYEGLGGSVLEAMALEVPVVASDVPALREVLAHGEAGELVTPGDGAALARTIDQLLTAPDRRRMLAAAGRSRFEAEYEFESVVERMASLFHEVSRG